jgi:hypothetical protein
VGEKNPSQKQGPLIKYMKWAWQFTRQNQEKRQPVNCKDLAKAIVNTHPWCPAAINFLPLASCLLRAPHMPVRRSKAVPGWTLWAAGFRVGV